MSVETRTYVNQQFDPDTFHRSYPGAFSASDIYAVLRLPGGEVRTLGSLVAMSFSTHRDTFPVTALSYVNARGFTQGHRTIAGTLMFHTIDRAAFLLPNYRGHAHVGQNDYRLSGTALPDELPLFDIHINHLNEHGMVSFEALFGIRLIDFGKTVSLENLQPIESYSYMALDYQPLRPILSAEPDEANFFLRSPSKATVLMGDGGPSMARVSPLQAGISEDTGVTLTPGA
jgi:hypothetical protein